MSTLSPAAVLPKLSLVIFTWPLIANAHRNNVAIKHSELTTLRDRFIWFSIMMRLELIVWSIHFRLLIGDCRLRPLTRYPGSARSATVSDRTNRQSTIGNQQ